MPHLLKNHIREMINPFAYAPEPLLTLGLYFIRFEQKCKHKAIWHWVVIVDSFLGLCAPLGFSPLVYFVASLKKVRY